MKTKQATVEELLNAKGLRLTASRRAVVDETLASDEPFSVAEMQRRLPHLGRATVFRTIRLLVEIGLLCRVLLEDGTPCYRASAAAHHHHLVCTGCGSVEDFAECDLSAVSAALAGRTNYEIQGHRLELFGLCPTCQVSTR
ncbi:MAG: Fur family transcriptional regulator [Dehalococcoidia bacterium]|jgi:Fe2+ or Zn2+ uptake regulation protein